MMVEKTIRAVAPGECAPYAADSSRGQAPDQRYSKEGARLTTDNGVANLMTSPNKACTVRLDLDISKRLAFDNRHMGNPGRLLFIGLTTAGGQQGCAPATNSVSTNRLENAG